MRRWRRRFAVQRPLQLDAAPSRTGSRPAPAPAVAAREAGPSRETAPGEDGVQARLPLDRALPPEITLLLRIGDWFAVLATMRAPVSEAERAAAAAMRGAADAVPDDALAIVRQLADAARECALAPPAARGLAVESLREVRDAARRTLKVMAMPDPPLNPADERQGLLD